MAENNQELPKEETVKITTEEEPVKITTDNKKKSPGRVEWAKKLNVLSQQAKKRKKEGKQTNKKLELIKETTDEDLTVDKSSNKYLIYISLGGLFIGGIGLYYQRMIYNKEIDDKSEIVDKPEILVVQSNNKSDVMME